MPVALEHTETAILDRAIGPAEANWPDVTARSLLEISLSAADAQRRDELAEKARQGALSAEETVELQNYGHVGRLLELMKAKARVSLRRSSRGS